MASEVESGMERLEILGLVGAGGGRVERLEIQELGTWWHLLSASSPCLNGTVSPTFGGLLLAVQSVSIGELLLVVCPMLPIETRAAE